MPFASTKSKEQLETEKKQKQSAMVLRAVGLLERVARMRGLDQGIKMHLQEVSADLSQLAKAVGPVGQ